MLKIAVCDDSRELLEKVEKDLLEYESVRSTPVTIHTYTNAMELLDGLKKTDYDILILDIIMPGFTGMQAAHEIRKFNEEIKIIFLTSSKEFAIESYSVGAYYYLLKPVLKEKLFSVLDKVVSEITSKQESCVIYTHMGIVNIPFARIEWLEVYNKHLVFHLSDGSTKETRGALTDYENVFLERKEFLKIHRSCILNMDYIHSIEAGEIATYSGKRFPVSRLLAKDIKEHYMNYMFTKEV